MISELWSILITFIDLKEVESSIILIASFCELDHPWGFVSDFIPRGMELFCFSTVLLDFVTGVDITGGLVDGEGIGAGGFDFLALLLFSFPLLKLLFFWFIICIGCIIIFHLSLYMIWINFVNISAWFTKFTMSIVECMTILDFRHILQSNYL